MALYRVLTRLLLPCGQVYEAGAVGTLSDVSEGGRSALLECGAVAEVKSPPLRVLRDFEPVAGELEAIGIEDVAQLVCADRARLAARLGITAGKVNQMVEVALGYIS